MATVTTSARGIVLGWNETTGGDVFMYNSSVQNDSEMAFPRYPTFDHISLVKVIVLFTLFTIALVGNCLTLWRILRIRRQLASFSTLLMHLCVADLLVCFFCIFGDAIWAATVQWLAGEAVCKMVKYFQVFSLYLSTYLVVLISVDRCLAVSCPLLGNRRSDIVKVLVGTVWMFSAFASVPQSFIFRVSRAPFPKEFSQCITDEEYRQTLQEDLYIISSTALLFLVPLVIISSCYVIIICIITRRPTDDMQANNATPDSPSPQSVRQQQETVYHSELFRLAKRRSLAMSFMVVVAFILCWSPYYLSMFGSKYFQWDDVGPNFQTSIFFFGMSNSFINPLIYGLFHISKLNKCRTMCHRRYQRPRSMRRAVLFQQIELR